MIYRKLKGYKYELLEFVRHPVQLPPTPMSMSIRNYLRIESGFLVILKYYAWDGPSGPTFDTKTFMRGSLIHDALYQLMRGGYLDRKYRKYADIVLRNICLEDGMNEFRAWYVYQAVRIFSKGCIKLSKNLRGKIIEI